MKPNCFKKKVQVGNDTVLSLGLANVNARKKMFNPHNTAEFSYCSNIRPAIVRNTLTTLVSEQSCKYLLLS